MNPDSQGTFPSPKLRERLREATREAILSAAEAVFAEEGLHAARMEAIAGRAGVAVGTVYNHFEDREALLSALLGARNDELVGRMDTTLAQSALHPFAEQLNAFYSALLEHFLAHRPFLAIFMQAERCLSPSAPMGSAVPSSVMREVLERAERLVANGLLQKALRPSAADLLPLLCVGLVRSVLVGELLYTLSPVPIATRVEQLVTFFLEGAKNVKEP